MVTVVLLSFPLPFFFFVKEDRNSLLSGLYFLSHMQVSAANPLAYTMSIPRFTSYLSHSDISSSPKVNTAYFLEHQENNIKTHLKEMKEHQILTRVVYFTYSCLSP